MGGRPRVAITVGDPSGIGPEIAARAAEDPSVLDVCDPVLYAPTDPGTARLSGEGQNLAPVLSVSPR